MQFTLQSKKKKMSHFNLTSRLKKQTMLAGIQDTFSYMSKKKKKVIANTFVV